MLSALQVTGVGFLNILVLHSYAARHLAPAKAVGGQQY